MMTHLHFDLHQNENQCFGIRRYFDVLLQLCSPILYQERMNKSFR